MARRDLKAEFDAFHAANPRVYALFERFTFEAIHAGHQHYSADAIMHRIRWETSVVTRGGEDFKLNDHYVAFYARLFMDRNPHHRGFFRTRRSVADETANHQEERYGCTTKEVE